MLQPSRTKFRKQQRGKMRGMATRGSTLSFGDFALKAQGSAWISSRQIEAARRAITGHVKRGRILFEIGDVPEDIAIEALKRAGHKLPIPTKIISREEVTF